MPYVEHSWYTKEEFEYIDDDRAFSDSENEWGIAQETTV